MQNEPTMNDWLFIGEYVMDWKPGAAIVRAGIYHGDFPSSEACRRLAKPCVKAEVEKMRELIKGKVQLTTALIAQDIVNVLSADPRELFEVTTIACRHCHGDQHLYQRTLNEFRQAEFKANAEGKEFKIMGGVGFNPYKGPHPDCPECFGRGEILEELKDVRFLSPAAAALYMGGKRGKHGIEINMRSKDAARAAAALYLGMNKQTLDLNTRKAVDLTDDELAAIVKGEAGE